MEKREERSSKWWYSSPNFSMTMSIRVPGLDAPCRPRTWSTSSCVLSTNSPKRTGSILNVSESCRKPYSLPILCHESLEKVTGNHGLRSKSRNHQDKRDGKPWSWSIRYLEISKQKPSGADCWTPLAAPPFLGHCTSSRHGSKLLADGLTISTSKALHLLAGSPHFYGEILLVKTSHCTQWCLLFHHPICVHVSCRQVDPSPSPHEFGAIWAALVLLGPEFISNVFKVARHFLGSNTQGVWLGLRIGADDFVAFKLSTVWE